MDSARQVIGCRLTHETRVHVAFDDVASTIHQSLFPGQPVLMTSGGDNSVKQWIFDNQDGTARLLKFRAGHSAPPTHVTFYGRDSWIVLQYSTS